MGMTISEQFSALSNDTYNKRPCICLALRLADSYRSQVLFVFN